MWEQGDWPGGVRAPTANLETEAVSIEDWARLQPRGKGPLRTQPDRPHFTSMNNLFLHTGQQSSLRQTSLHSFPKCNAVLSPHLWQLEYFQPHCKAQQVSPCN